MAFGKISLQDALSVAGISGDSLSSGSQTSSPTYSSRKISINDALSIAGIDSSDYTAVSGPSERQTFPSATLRQNVGLDNLWERVLKPILKKQYSKENIIKTLSGLAVPEAIFKQYIYNPQEKKVFPSSIVWDIQEIERLPVGSKERRQKEIRLASSLAFMASAGIKQVGGGATGMMDIDTARDILKVGKNATAEEIKQATSKLLEKEFPQRIKDLASQYKVNEANLVWRAANTLEQNLPKATKPFALKVQEPPAPKPQQTIISDLGKTAPAEMQRTFEKLGLAKVAPSGKTVEGLPIGQEIEKGVLKEQMGEGLYPPGKIISPEATKGIKPEVKPIPKELEPLAKEEIKFHFEGIGKGQQGIEIKQFRPGGPKAEGILIYRDNKGRPIQLLIFERPTKRIFYGIEKEKNLQITRELLDRASKEGLRVEKGFTEESLFIQATKAVKPEAEPKVKPIPEVNWAVEKSKPFEFRQDCTLAGSGEAINKMVDVSEDISYNEFVKVVGKDKLSEMFPQYKWREEDESPLKMSDDYSVSFSRSVFKGEPAYYVTHSGIEYVFTNGTKLLEPTPREVEAEESRILAEMRGEMAQEEAQMPYAKEIQKFKNLLQIAGEKKSKETGELFREHIPASVFGVSSDEVASALGKSENEFMAELTKDIDIVRQGKATPQVYNRIKTKIEKIKSMAEALKLDKDFYQIVEDMDSKLKTIPSYKSIKPYRPAEAVGVEPTAETLERARGKEEAAKTREANVLFKEWQAIVNKGAITEPQRVRKLINDISYAMKVTTEERVKTKFQNPEIKRMSEEGKLRDLTKFDASEIGFLTPDRAARIVAGNEGYKTLYEPAEKALVAKEIEDEVWDRVVKKWSKALGYRLFNKKYSNLAQQYAEGLISETKLAEMAKNKAKAIKQVAFESRVFYDDFLERMNEGRRLLGRDEIPRRTDYVTHIQELNFFRSIRGSLLDVDYSDFIEFIKKDAPGNPFAKQRLGGAFTSDLIKSFSAYYPVATREIYMTEPIRVVNQNIELLPPNAQKYFRKYVNQNLAGVPTTLDAWVKDNLLSLPAGRQISMVSNWVSNKVGKNLIVGNLNTILQQPSSIATTISEIGLKNAILGHTYYLTREGYNLAHNACDVLKGRSVVDIPESLVGAGEKWAATPLEIFDQTMVGGAFLGSLKKNLSEGVEWEEALSLANDVAGRTQVRYKRISRAPILRHRVIRNTVGMFQTFTINLFNYVTRDIPEAARVKGTGEALSRGIKLLVSVLAINYLYEKAGLKKPFTLTTFFPFLGAAKFGPPPHIEITKKLFDKVAGKETTRKDGVISDIFHYILMPYGGGQLRRIESVLKGESRTAPSKKYPKGQRRFKIQGTSEILKTLVGGEWATEAGEKYLIKKGIKKDALKKFLWIITGEKKYKQ